MNATFIDDGKKFNFNNVVKLEVNDNDTNIGYTDNDGVYHEEVGNTPSEIILTR